MKRKFILLPITLTALTPAIGLIGCNNPDTPTPEVTKYHFGFTGNYCKINGHGHIDIDIEQDSKVEYTVLPDDGFKLSETQDLPEGISLTGNLLTIEKMDKAYEVTINAELDKHVEFVISKSETSVETQSVLWLDWYPWIDNIIFSNLSVTSQQTTIDAASFIKPELHSRPQKISLAFEQPLSKDLDDCIVEFDYGDTTQKTTGHAILENVHVERYIAPIQPFETCDWDFIDRKATALEYGEITQEEFYKSFTVNNKTPTSMNDFIGVKRKVQLKHQDLNSNGVIDNNEVYQTVRVIGTSADNTSEYQVNRIEGNRKVALTFEFVDFISDANGYSVASFWQDTATAEGSNHDYLNSTIRKNISGYGHGECAWYGTTLNGSTLTGDTVKATEITHPDYYNKSVYEMLPDNLVTALKAPLNRVVNEYNGSDWVETRITDPLFLLTQKEIAPNASQTSESSMKPYRYYSGSGDSNANRQKKQIKGSSGAIGATLIADSKCQRSDVYSYAGYHTNGGEANGSRYWLSSPANDIDNDKYAFSVTEYGYPAWIYSWVYAYAKNVAPAFCI